jgi:hypothetical protein
MPRSRTARPGWHPEHNRRGTDEDDTRAPAQRSPDVHDLLTGDRYTWGARNYVRRNTAAGEPVHLFRVQKG